MDKVLNPFFSTGTLLKKWGKYTGLALVGAAGIVALEVLPAYTSVLCDAIGGTPGMILGAILPILIAGGMAAMRNFQKNYTVTPERLAEILAGAEAAKTVQRFSLSPKELRELIRKAEKLAKR